MKKNYSKRCFVASGTVRASGSASTIGEVLCGYFNRSDEPLAVAYRRRRAVKAQAEKGGIRS